jgi:hypothetical protein
LVSNGRYVWIWELNRSEKGDVAKLVQRAHDLGLAGYILKTHDGSSFWHQANAVQEFKNEGLSCGAWGYCYGKNISGELDAIRKTAALNPDFYVMDVEAEFEPASMRSTAEQMLTGLQDLNIPLGYTSFAIPSLHTVPFDIFSKYCKFTMPQIYWALMRWGVAKAFNQSVAEYGKYGLPVIPIGQLTSDVAVQEISEFNTLCASDNFSAISYWDYQEAGNPQFDAIRYTPGGMTLQDAITILVKNGIILGPDYWNENAVDGKTVNGAYAGILIVRAAEKLTNQAFTV